MTENLKTILEASYKPQVQASQDLEKIGFKYDPELSSMENKVFVDEEGSPHIAYRGSVRVSDWVDNARLGLTGKSKKLDEKVALAKTVQDKYGKAPTTYGHSRGGLFSERAGEATGGTSYTYNKATLPTDVFKKTRSQQTDIRTNKDIVSLPSYFQTGGTKITLQSPVVSNAISSHSLAQLNQPKTKSLFQRLF